MTEEQKAYDLAVDNHARAMDRIAELEREVERQKMNCLNLHQQLEDLKAQPSGVVLPERRKPGRMLEDLYTEGWNNCMDEVANLNQQPASGGDERAAFEVEIPSIVATYDGLYLAPVMPLKAGERLMTIAQHQRIEKQIRAALSAPSHGEQVRHMVPAWNLAADELPASGKTVLAFYLNSHGMGRRIRAMHVKRFTVEAEEFADPDTQCCEYSEQDDCYYTTEGWYELIDNWPDYSSCAVIEGVITHWMPLPAAPSPSKQGGV